MSEIHDNKYSEEKARNEAIDLQHSLYGNITPYLRANEGFSPEKYNEVEKAKQEQTRIINIILNLPKFQPERSLKLAELFRKESFEKIFNSWDELERQHETSKEYKKFAELAYLIFEETDKTFKGQYATKEQGGYFYQTPSTFYMPLAFTLYQKVSGANYSNAEELKANFINGIKGKKVLELACGPGWFLKLLKDYGAEVSGIEKNSDPTYSHNYKVLNIQIGDAKNISYTNSEQFDIVLTNNFFNTLCISPEEEAQIIKNIILSLKPKGVSINSTQDFKTSKELRILIAVKKIIKTDPVAAKNSLLYLIDPNYRGEFSYTETHKPAIPEDTLKNVGFTNFTTCHENGYFVFSFEK